MRRWMTLIPICLIIVLGCSAATRERLKHWFFEVPEPTGEQAAAEEPPPETEEPPAVERVASRFQSVHPPYRNRECASCHNPEQRMQVREDLMDACGECHERFFSDEVTHFPVMQGECIVCHDPHRSARRWLLKQPVLDTCVECHDEPAYLSEEAHGGDNVDDCTRCHDAHFGGSGLLKPGVTAGD